MPLRPPSFCQSSRVSDKPAALYRLAYSAGASNDRGSRNPFVFQAPNAMPAAIHADPRIFARTLRFHHSPRQTKNPTNGTAKFHTVLTRFFTKKCAKDEALTPMNASSAP